MGYRTNVNCKSFKNGFCINKKRRMFFGLFQNSNCCEISNEKCDLKEERKRPELPPRGGSAFMPKCKPHINKAVLSFLHEYENNIESYTLEQDLHEIKLTIKLPLKEKDISIEEFMK